LFFCCIILADKDNILFMSEQLKPGNQIKKEKDFSLECADGYERISELNNLLAGLRLDRVGDKNEKNRLKKRIKDIRKQAVNSNEDVTKWLKDVEILESEVADFSDSIKVWNKSTHEEMEKKKKEAELKRRIVGTAAAANKAGANAQPVSADTVPDDDSASLGVVEAENPDLEPEDAKTEEEALQNDLDQEAEVHIINEREEINSAGVVANEDLSPEDIIVGPVVGKLEGSPEKKDSLSDLEKNAELRRILEKQESLEELKTLVKEKRIACAREDYKNTNQFKRLKSILGIKKNPYNNKETFAYQQYQGALHELRDLEIQSLKDAYANIDSLPEDKKELILAEMKQKMGELATYFGVDEKIELAAARTDARTEAWAETGTGKFADTALKKSAEMINWYRKLDPKLKMAVSGTLFAVGGVAGLTGAVGIASTVASVKLLQRCISGAVLGTGVAGGLEAWSRKKAKDKVKNDKEEIINKEDWTEKFNALNDYCSKEMRTFHESLQKEKSGAIKRKLIGAGVGVFVGSGAAADCAKWGFGMAKKVVFFMAESPGAEVAWASPTTTDISHSEISSPGAGLQGDNAAKLNTAPAALQGAMKYPEAVNSNADLSKGDAVKINTSPVSEIKENPVKLEAKVSAPDEIKPAEVAPEGNLDPNASPPTETEKAPAEASVPKPAEVKVPEAKLVDVPNPEINANIAEVKIAKGGSIEKAIIKQLQERGVFNKVQAGGIAHRMALDYAKEHSISFVELNHVKPGDILKLEIDPDNLEGMKIADFERVSGVHQDAVSDIKGADNNPTSHSKADVAGKEVETKAGGRTDKISNVPKLQDVENPKAADSAILNNTEEVKAKIKTSPFTKAEEATLSRKRFPPNMEYHEDDDVSSPENTEDKGIDKKSFPPKPREDDYIPSPDNTELTPTESANIKEIGEKLGGNWVDNKAISNQLLALRHLEGERFLKMYGRVMGNMASGIFKEHGIGSMEALRHIDAREYINSGDNPKISALIEYGKEHFKNYDFEPKNGEAMDSWTMRVLRKTMESCGVSSGLGIRKG
jgi:hypothetical protein